MRTIVFTNGVFDLLHVGHIRLLQWARMHGQQLIVAINSDESAKRLKGSSRPIQLQEARAEMLRAIVGVDQVRIFNEDDPVRLINAIRPQVLVKGPEARGAYIPGTREIESWGGRVITPEWPVSVSTSQLIEHIRTSGVETCLPSQTSIYIDGRKTPPIGGTSIAFAGEHPYLVHNGRRVTARHRVELVFENPKDEMGASA